jgi:hypothetical protein
MKMFSKKRVTSFLAAFLMCTILPLNGAGAADYTPAIISEIAGGQTLLNYPSDLAVAPNGDVLWSDWAEDKIFLFDKDATGDTAPKKIISMKRPDNSGDVSAIAVDAAGFIYASDAQSDGSAFVRVFNPNLSDSQTISNAVRTITLERRSRGIAVDAAGYIYVGTEVSDSDSHLKVSVYAPGVTNSASADPVRSFTDIDETANDYAAMGLAVNPAGEVIYGSPQSDSIRIYANNSTGTPLRTISGDQTQLSTLCGYWRVRIDSIGRIYVGCSSDTANKKILVFESSANGNVAPSAVVIRTLSGEDSPFALSGNSNIWFISQQKIRKIANPLTFPTPQAAAPAAVSEAQAKAAAAVAAAKREAEVKTARADISKALEKADNLTADSFAKAEIAGVTKENIAEVQAEILALPAELRTDINQVLKVARKFEVVGKIASEQATALPISAFVEVGLIPTDSKNKVALIAAIRRASADSRDSFADIKAVIAAEAARIQDRKDRLAAAMNRLKSK